MLSKLVTMAAWVFDPLRAVARMTGEPLPKRSVLTIPAPLIRLVFIVGLIWMLSEGNWGPAAIIAVALVIQPLILLATVLLIRSRMAKTNSGEQ